MKVSPKAAAKDGMHTYEGAVPCRTSGLHGYSIRVIPSHPDLISPFEPGLVTWAS
jgi:starch phosphorylase